jgi:hypothetical protein
MIEARFDDSCFFVFISGRPLTVLAQTRGPALSKIRSATASKLLSLSPRGIGDFRLQNR